MKFYTVSDAFIAHLKDVDARVPNNYSGTRPYIGIILQMQDHRYIAPLTSYKLKHEQIKTSSPTIFKLYEVDNPTNKLGMLQLNNMIPILDSEVTMVKFEDQEPRYKDLLKKQLRYIVTHQDEISARANNLYSLVTVQKLAWARNLSCDFKLLEKHYQSF